MKLWLSLISGYRIPTSSGKFNFASVAHQRTALCLLSAETTPRHKARRKDKISCQTDVLGRIPGSAESSDASLETQGLTFQSASVTVGEDELMFPEILAAVKCLTKFRCANINHPNVLRNRLIQKTKHLIATHIFDETKQDLFHIFPIFVCVRTWVGAVGRFFTYCKTCSCFHF
jgi:hypothetical protein